MEEQLVALLERVAIALEKLEKDGILVVHDPDNIRAVLEEVGTSTQRP